MSRICVKNLGKSTNEKQLKDLFGTKGEVTDVRIVKTKSGKSRQLAFLGFRTEVQAQEAISYFNNTFLETARIIVESAKKIGDQTLIDSTRSKITKKKLEKAAKEQSVESQKVRNEARLAAKKAPTTKEPISKEKSDFMEAMKPRRNTQFWANDESLPSTLASIEDGTDGTIPPPSENYPVEDDDSDVDDEDINDFSNSAPSATASDAASKKAEKTKKMFSDITADSDVVGVKVVASGGSDMDYLRSKVKAHFSDDEVSDTGDQMDANSDDESVEPVKGKSGKHASSSSSINQKTGEESSEAAVVTMSEEQLSTIKEGGEAVDSDEYEDSGRLFIRNLTFSCTEDEIKNIFGVYGPITIVHLPLDGEKKSKGFGFVQFMIPEQAQKAREELDGSSFQGRLLHIINAKKAPEIVPKDLDAGKSKLSSFQQKKEEDRRKMANRTEGWNASFVRSDAVVDSLADRYGVSRSEILDRTEGGGEMAVRLAIGEAHVIQENRDYFSSHGVDLGALESHASNSKASSRSTTTLLVKNLPHDVIEDEIESMFSRFGNIATLLIPKSKSVALIDFVEPTEARAAFKGLSYRKYHNVPIYLEWAPTGIIDKSKAALKKAESAKKHLLTDQTSTDKDSKKSKETLSKEAAEDDETYSTLFVKNLNFSSDEDSLRHHIDSLGVKGLRTVSITKKTKGDYLLSTGFGFAEFKSTEAAGLALKKLDGSVLDGHALQIKPSEKRISKGSVKGGNGGKGKITGPKGVGTMKLIVRNLAFQATENELKALFSSFGAVKRVRIPKKMGGVHRGFGFVDFTTVQEAAAAMAALMNAHLYGRHLVIEYARDEDEDLDLLRKRAKLDEGAIKQDKKRRRIDDVIEGEGSAGVGTDDM